ncbi:MAG: Yip1 family protein [Thermoanaerobaculia bacterium]
MTEIPQQTPTPEKSKNVFARIAGVLFAPAETFQEIVRRPDVIGPLLIIVIFGYISTAVIIPKIDFESMMAQQAEQMSKQGRTMSEDQRAQMQRITMASVKVFSWVLPVLMVAWYAIVAGVLLLAFRLMGGEGNFMQAFSVTLYAWMPMVLLGILTTIIVIARGTFDPVTAATLVKSNLAFLVDMKEQPLLFSLLSSFDLFTIWTIALLVVGFAIMARVSKGKAAAIVVSLWMAVVVVKLGFAAIGASRMK